MQIFSTWGTSTCNSRMMVCRGSFVFHDNTWDRQVGRGHMSCRSSEKAPGEDGQTRTDPVRISTPGRGWRHAGQATPRCFWLCAIDLTTRWRNHINSRRTQSESIMMWTLAYLVVSLWVGLCVAGSGCRTAGSSGLWRVWMWHRDHGAILAHLRLLCYLINT